MAVDSPFRIPNVIFRTRVRDALDKGYVWDDVTTQKLFAGKRCILFSLPGAFTPTCTERQVPDFEAMFPLFKQHGIDEIYCMSVNDTFVMNAWAKNLELKHVKVIPDGSAIFTTFMDMDVQKDNLGFGIRSWRYALIVNDMRIEKSFIEQGKEDNADLDPYEATNPWAILDYLAIPAEGGRALTLNLTDGVDSKAKMT
tara:strand:+ start:1086 stop:1679 length:594 start_codon:yes stop_codon:yes gene_type:complete